MKLKCFYFSFFIFLFFVSRIYAFDFLREKPDSILVTNIFYETDIRQALQDLSAQAGVPILIDPSVHGFVNVEFESVSLEEALNMILLPLGYSYKKINNYYIVGMALPESPVFDVLAKTEVVDLDYVKAAEVSDLVSDFFKPFIKANPSNNTVTITAPEHIISRFREDIAKIDSPRQQVMMEALVVEVSESASKSLGIRWGSMHSAGFTVRPPSDFNYQYGGTAAKDQLTLSGTVAPSTLFTLNTLISQGQASVRANPRISALDGEEASIFIGREEFFLIGSGTPGFYHHTLQSIDTGVTLTVTPKVSSMGDITVKIEPEVSEVVGIGTGNLPIVNRRKVSTTVRVKDGDTIAIGGLIQRNVVQDEDRVPMMGKIPLLGRLFKFEGGKTEDKEVIIFITPHLSGLDDRFYDYEASGLRGGGAERQLKSSNLGSRSFSPNKVSMYRISRPNNERQSLESSRAYDDESYMVERYSNYVIGLINTSNVNNLLLALYDSSVINNRVVADFDVDRAGYVSRVNIVRPSGSDMIDSVVREAILKASPLPKFPREVRRNSLRLTMVFHLK